MTICEHEHRQIAYDENETDNKGNNLRCPMCEADAKIYKLEDQIIELKKKLKK